MWRFALLLAETATVTPPADNAQACDRGGTEIVVCARAAGPDRYRLPPSGGEPAAGPPRAEWSLGGGIRAGIAASQSPLPQGASSPRVMATVKIPF